MNYEILKLVLLKPYPAPVIGFFLTHLKMLQFRLLGRGFIQEQEHNPIALVIIVIIVIVVIMIVIKKL